MASQRVGIESRVARGDAADPRFHAGFHAAVAPDADTSGHAATNATDAADAIDAARDAGIDAALQAAAEAVAEAVGASRVHRVQMLSKSRSAEALQVLARREEDGEGKQAVMRSQEWRLGKGEKVEGMIRGEMEGRKEKKIEGR